MNEGYDGYDDEYDDEQPLPQEYARPARRRSSGGATPVSAGLAGLVIGALLAGIALTLIGGNPFSSVNDVVYQQVVVAEISDEGDVLCWPKDPADRGSDRSCAILALDPAAEAPTEGDRITIGLVRLRPPDGKVVTQAVYARSTTQPQETSEEGAVDPAEDDADPDAEASGELRGDEPAATE